MFTYYDHKNKRYWMSGGNVRTCKNILEQKRGEDVLENFIQQNAVRVTTTKETVFIHPEQQMFRAEQTNPNFEPQQKEEDEGKSASFTLKSKE